MSIFTLLAAVTASATALWIAYRVYPLQKSEDRRIKLAEEKAAIYRNFFDVADDHYEASKADFRMGKISDFALHFAGLNKSQRALLLYAPGDVIVRCNAYVDALHIYRYAVRKKFEGTAFPRKAAECTPVEAYWKAESARKDALIAARVDLLGCTADNATDAVKGMMTSDEEE